jgi:hypothetical protein
MIRIDASARKWEPLGCSKCYLALQSTSMRELRRVYGIHRQKWTQLSAQFIR